MSEYAELVRYLRNGWGRAAGIFDQAADAIERLEAENMQLRENAARDEMQWELRDKSPGHVTPQRMAIELRCEKAEAERDALAAKIADMEHIRLHSYGPSVGHYYHMRHCDRP